jgi:hypothetical protein
MEVDGVGVDAILGAVHGGTRADVDAQIAEHGPLKEKRRVRKRYRYFNINLQRCPRCADGMVVASVVVRDGNQVRISPLHHIPLAPERVKALFD